MQCAECENLTRQPVVSYAKLSIRTPRPETTFGLTLLVTTLLTGFAHRWADGTRRKLRSKRYLRSQPVSKPTGFTHHISTTRVNLITIVVTIVTDTMEGSAVE